MHRSKSARIVIAAIAGFAALTSACSGVGAASGSASSEPTDQASQSATHPISGLELIEVTVKRRGDERAPLVFTTEHANTPEAQARGLMYRTELGDFEGMLFPSPVPQMRSFWMKNTPIALDIIFIGADGRISNIAARTTPYSLASVSSSEPAAAVFEIRGGRAEELGIEPGDEVVYTAE